MILQQLVSSLTPSACTDAAHSCLVCLPTTNNSRTMGCRVTACLLYAEVTNCQQLDSCLPAFSRPCSAALLSGPDSGAHGACASSMHKFSLPLYRKLYMVCCHLHCLRLHNQPLLLPLGTCVQDNRLACDSQHYSPYTEAVQGIEPPLTPILALL
jgi:hypothetical protein